MKKYVSISLLLAATSLFGCGNIDMIPKCSITGDIITSEQIEEEIISVSITNAEITYRHIPSHTKKAIIEFENEEYEIYDYIEIKEQGIFGGKNISEIINKFDNGELKNLRIKVERIIHNEDEKHDWCYVYDSLGIKN